MGKHFGFLDRRFELTELEGGYSATMDDELFRATRTDTGIENIEDDVLGERDGSDRVEVSVMSGHLLSAFIKQREQAATPNHLLPQDRRGDSHEGEWARLPNIL